MIVRTRIAMAKDIGRMIDIETKSIDYPTGLESLKEYVLDANKIGLIAFIGTKDVGYAIAALTKTEMTTRMVVGRLCVSPDFRNLGVSKALMSELSKKALNERCHSIVFSVPSYKIDDREDPDYIGWWFESMELKASHVETDFYFRYGKHWDAYLFEALV